MAVCRSFMDGKYAASRLRSGAEPKFRRFVRYWPHYFDYDREQDTIAVARHSPSSAADEWVVRYLALRIEESPSGCLAIGEEPVAAWGTLLPTAMARHFGVLYAGDLLRFLRLHSADFILDGDVARLSESRCQWNVAQRVREESLLFFFVDLLQKIGATEDAPCPIRTVCKYLSFIKSQDKTLLNDGYNLSLRVFFVLNHDVFVTTGWGVFLRNRDPRYGAALFLKQLVKRLVRIYGSRSSGQAPKVTVEELALIAKHSSSPLAQYFVDSAENQVRAIARRYPAMFHVSERGDQLWLRDACPPWPENGWNAGAESSAVAYFTDVLLHVGATSLSRAICFNNIVGAVSAAPASCKTYLESVYPALEVIDFFHLHPSVFDLSSVNRVFLKNVEVMPPAAPAGAGGQSDGA
ncbi:hypothetical protein V5799_031539 [Amblyomma americanum]|uniref:Uncharacterized protein n=1 Tax=Amblyomma americanum TaxID=6943 RepID=A0AAQ4EKY5_AMBAM